MGGQATRTCTSRALPSSRSRAASARKVVARTIESSTRNTRLPVSTLGSGVYLRPALASRVVAGSMKVRPT